MALPTPFAQHAETVRNESPGVSPRYDLVIVTLLALAICKLWLFPLRTGFWLDETGSYWAIQGGWGEIYSRALEWPAQPPLFSVILWLFHQLPLPLELSLRVPSMLAAAGTVVLLFRMADKLFNRQAAWISVVLLACSHPVYFAAADARPYATAMFLLVASTALLLRWLERGRLFDALAYGVVAGLMLHMHYIFGTGLLAHAGFVLLVWPRSRQKARLLLQAGAAIAALILVLLPLLPHLLAMVATRAGRAFAAPPTLDDLFAQFAPALLICVGGGALLLALLLPGGTNWKFKPAPPESWQLAALLLVLPTLALFAMSAVALPVFIPRYLLPALAGTALAAGWAVSFAPRIAQRIFAAGIVFASILSSPDGVRNVIHGGDYRALIAAARLEMAERGPAAVVFRVGFSETTVADWSSPAERATPYFRATLDTYPLPAETFLVPYRATPSALAYMEAIVPALQRHSRILILEFGDLDFAAWLDARLRHCGFVRSPRQKFGGSLNLIALEKPRSAICREDAR